MVTAATKYSEEELLPLSGLQHLSFCERQCALIHVEGLWDENRLTVLGTNLHDRSHQARSEERDGTTVARALPLCSYRLGVVGKADVVEFRLTVSKNADGQTAEMIPFPIEYKRGRPKPDRCDEVQVCAQAMCLEEMTGIAIAEGAIYYGEPRRRQQLRLDDDLRQETERLAARFHDLVTNGETPQATYQRKCRSCSLVESCMPRKAKQVPNARRYVLRMIKAVAEEELELADGEE